MHLFVIRHAQPHDESETGGHGDPPLSELGMRQADAICRTLEAEAIDHIVSSPMVRAHQTAKPLAATLGIEIEFDDDLKEAGWQAGPYLRTEENMSHFVDQMQQDPEHLYRPEGKAVFSERVMRCFSRVAHENQGRRVAVFCHGMVTTTVTAHALGHDPAPDQLHPDYSSLTRIQVAPRRGLWSLRSFNETMHLADIGIS